MIHLIYMTTECKNGKVSYFRFDDDSLTTYKYVISIIKIGISQKKMAPYFTKQVIEKYVFIHILLF